MGNYDDLQGHSPAEEDILDGLHEEQPQTLAPAPAPEPEPIVVAEPAK
jgi:hypothetical protein